MSAQAVMEPCPPRLLHEEQPQYGGHLFFNEHGIAGCQHCGWTGVPTIIRGVISTWCPGCQADRGPEDSTGPVRIPRNQQCPCGSGTKAKRCGCEGYTV